MAETAAAGWLAEQEIKTCTDQDRKKELILVVQEGIEAKANTLKYADWLVTTCNASIPDETYSLPDPHPCAVAIDKIVDIDSDYHDMVNSVQRHTRCSSAYCLRKKPGQEEKCRFDYPRPLLESSTFEFEKLDSGMIRTTLITQRNDPRVNSHNRVMLQHWRANVDVQIIIDVEACARYMAKYAAKAEPRSKSVKTIFKTCVDTLHDDSDSRKALRSAMLRAVGERDFSSQETAHMLLSLPLVSCSYNFVTVSLNGSKMVTKDQQSGDILVQPSIMDAYATRSGLSDTNLCQFAAQYTVCRGKVSKRSLPVIVRTFPTYSSNPQSEVYGLYCKYQLLKYKPWEDLPSNAWGGGTDSDENCINMYNMFLHSDAGKLQVPHFTRDLIRAQEYHDKHSNDCDEDEEDIMQESAQEDDWMLLCRINQRFAMESQTVDDTVDWAASARTLSPEILRECPSWIKSRRKESDDNPTSPWHRTLPPADPSTLNEKQLLAYSTIIQHHAKCTTDQTPPSPLYMLVCGTAGTGKSYLISSIVHTLGNACLLTGTTGMASFNICGKTLHSALKLPIHNTNHQDLQGNALHRLQQSLKNVSYLIIDEMSMIGHRMLAWVDKRLRQATARLDLPMGGISVILFGDFGQLPPVGDRPLYVSPSTNDLAIHGHSIYQMFNTVVILSQVLRQAGSDPAAEAFRELLLRLRNGKITHDDWQMLLQRSPQSADNLEEFNDAIRLFYTKESVANFNYEKLQTLGTPIARINAVHSSPAAASTKPDEAGGLYPVVFLAQHAHVMLTANLWQEVVLCNGAAGTVHQILYPEGSAPPNLPIAVMVEFDNYCGPQFFSHNCVPIPLLLSEWTSAVGNRLSRQQLPLQLRYAITIHKSQGQTLKKAVIDIGRAEFAAGCTFVATSRLQKLKDGLFEPMPFQRLKAISNGKYLAQRMKEEERLHQLSRDQS